MRPYASRNSAPVVVEHRPIALLEKGDPVGEGRERERVGAEIHLALAEADGERRAGARADEQIVLAGEHEGEREGALEARERRRHRLDRRAAAVELTRHELRHGLGVGLGLEGIAVRLELGAQLAEILDDAVMHDGEPLRRMRMGVALGRTSMRRPARMADADEARERRLREPRLEIAQLAFGAPPLEPAFLQGRDAGGIITSIFEAFQRIDELRRHRRLADDPDNAAHVVPFRRQDRPRFAF